MNKRFVIQVLVRLMIRATYRWWHPTLEKVLQHAHEKRIINYSQYIELWVLFDRKDKYNYLMDKLVK